MLIPPCYSINFYCAWETIYLWIIIDIQTCDRAILICMTVWASA